MKGSASLLLMVLTATACSSAGGGLASPSAPVSWPAGRYELEASVEYEQDTETREGTETEEYFAELDVLPTGTMNLPAHPDCAGTIS